MSTIDRLLRVYLIADPDQSAGPLVAAVESALHGGVTAVQLRAKTLADRDVVELGRTLRQLTRAHSIPLLVNDRLDIALAIDADGVHLGATDMHPNDARKIAPAGYIIGYSPDDAEDRAGDATADYYGIGPVFGTASKSDAGAALGLVEFERRIAIATKPVVGIGGITSGNAGQTVAHGASGVAVISAILGAGDPRAAAESLRQAVETARSR